MTNEGRYRVTLQRVVVVEYVTTVTCLADETRCDRAETAQDAALLEAVEMHGGSLNDWEIVRTEELDEETSTL